MYYGSRVAVQLGYYRSNLGVLVPDLVLQVGTAPGYCHRHCCIANLALQEGRLPFFICTIVRSHTFCKSLDTVLHRYDACVTLQYRHLSTGISLLVVLTPHIVHQIVSGSVIAR